MFDYEKSMFDFKEKGRITTTHFENERSNRNKDSGNVHSSKLTEDKLHVIMELTLHVNIQRHCLGIS
jgi:hypothetical protein